MEAAEAMSQGASGNLSGAGVAGAALGQFNKALGVPTWDGSTPEQRMEMMREEVRYLRRTVTIMEKEIGRLNRHQHAQDGALMVPLKHREGERPYGYHYDPLK